MKAWTIVAWKEFRDFVSDKRVRSSAFIMPIFLVVAMVYMFGMLQNTITKPTSQTIYILAKAHPSAFQSALSDGLKKAGVTVKMIDSLDAAKRKIESGDIKVLLEIGENSTPPFEVSEYYDPSNQASQVTISVLQEVFQTATETQLKGIMTQNGLPASMAEPIKVNQVKVHKGDQGAGEFVLELLPYLVVLWAFYGGMGSVGELVAGEKEKFTLETLLTTPVSRNSIALGKLTALAGLCLAGSLSAVVGIFVSMLIPLPSFRAVLSHGIGLTPVSTLIFILVLIPTAAMFSSIMLSISTRARNIREAMTQLAVISIIVIIPAIGSQFIGYTDFGTSWMVSLVPVLNSANTLRLALTGTGPWLAVLITFLINGAIAAAFITWTFHLFKKESVLQRI